MCHLNINITCNPHLCLKKLTSTVPPPTLHHNLTLGLLLHYIQNPHPLQIIIAQSPRSIACDAGGFSSAKGQMISKRKGKGFKSKASHSPVHSLVTLLPIAYSCSQFGSEFLLLFVQSTPDNSNLQGKSKKGSSYRQFEENGRE